MDTKTYTENLYSITFNAETAIDIPEVTDKLVRIILCRGILLVMVTYRTHNLVTDGRKFNYNASSTMTASTLNE
jgi:hypothetical protein